MLKNSLMIFFLVFLISCNRDNPDIPMTWMPDPTLKKDNREITESSIVFIGNSLTHIAVWEDFFPNVETANQGVGGNTTSHVLTRLDDVLKHRPKKIFLLIGANDLILGVEHAKITENHRLIIEKIVKESPETKLYVQSIFPFGEKSTYYFPKIPKTFRKDIKALNEALEMLCYLNAVNYLNVHDNLTNEKGYLKDKYTIDHIHLSKEGYDVWVKFLKIYVK